jgi:hypothetical protein
LIFTINICLEILFSKSFQLLTLTRALRVRVSKGKNVTVANQFTVSSANVDRGEKGNRTLFCPIFICRDLYSNSKYLNEESQKEQTKCYSSEPVYSSTAKGSN